MNWKMGNNLIGYTALSENPRYMQVIYEGRLGQPLLTPELHIARMYLDGENQVLGPGFAVYGRLPYNEANRPDLWLVGFALFHPDGLFRGRVVGAYDEDDARRATIYFTETCRQKDALEIALRQAQIVQARFLTKLQADVAETEQQIEDTIQEIAQSTARALKATKGLVAPVYKLAKIKYANGIGQYYSESSIRYELSARVRIATTMILAREEASK